METERISSIKERKITKEKKFLTVDLKSGDNIFASDPDKNERCIKGAIPSGAVVRTIFDFADKRAKGSNFNICSVREIVSQKQKVDDLDVGIDNFWHIHRGSPVYVNKYVLSIEMVHKKRDKAPNFKQPEITNFPKIKKTR